MTNFHITLTNSNTVWFNNVIITPKNILKTKEIIVNKNPNKFYFEFQTIEGKENVDKKKFLNRIKNILNDTDYIIDGSWFNRVEQGYIFNLHFQLTIIKK